MEQRKQRLRMISILAMMAAAAYLLSYARLSIVPGMPFLKYEPKDIVLAFSGILYGPFAGILTTVVVATLETLTRGTTGIIGWGLNILASVCFILPVSILYSRKKSIESAIVGLILGCLLMSSVLVLWNYILTPIFMGIPRKQVIPLLLSAVLPFNLVKSGINATLVLLTYKPLILALRKGHLLPERVLSAPTAQPRMQIYKGLIAAALFVLVSLICVLLVWNGVI